MDGAIRQEWVPELRRERVAFPEIGRGEVHGLDGDAREWLRPGGWRFGQPLRNWVRPAYGERRLDAPGEAISFNHLRSGDDDEIDQISDPRVLLAAGERVGVQLLGEVLDNGIDGKLDRGDPGELEEVRPSEEIGRIDERVSTGEVEVERHELEPGHARDNSDAQRTAGRALHLLGNFTEPEREVVPGRRCGSNVAQAVQRRRQVTGRAKIDVPGRARLQAVTELQGKTTLQDPLAVVWESGQQALEGDALLEALSRDAGA